MIFLFTMMNGDTFLVSRRLNRHHGRNKNDGILFASKWDGVKTVEQTLGGGNLVVR
jgi:hypothetical protein